MLNCSLHQLNRSCFHAYSVCACTITHEYKQEHISFTLGLHHSQETWACSQHCRLKRLHVKHDLQHLPTSQVVMDSERLFGYKVGGKLQTDYSQQQHVLRGSHTSHVEVFALCRERKGLVTLQPLSCRQGRNLLRPMRSSLRRLQPWSWRRKMCWADVGIILSNYTVW